MTYVEEIIAKMSADREQKLRELHEINAAMQALGVKPEGDIGDAQLGPRSAVEQVDGSAVEQVDEARRKVEPDKRPDRRRVKKGWRSRSRIGKTMAEWLEVIKREFGDGREFSAMEFASCAGGPTREYVEGGRAVLEFLTKQGVLDRYGVHHERGIRYRLRGGEQDPLNGLARAQAAWDEGRAAERTELTTERVQRGAPVAGVGRGPAAGLRGDHFKVVQAALRAGWIAERTGGDHIRFTHPEDPTRRFTAPTTPSDRRSIKRLRADMQRVGAPIA